MRHNSIVFTLDHYKHGKSDEEARVDMWKDISTFIQVLLKNNNIMVVREDDIDIIVIEYENDEHFVQYGCANPEWITAEEYESLVVDEKEE